MYLPHIFNIGAVEQRLLEPVAIKNTLQNWYVHIGYLHLGFPMPKNRGYTDAQ